MADNSRDFTVQVDSPSTDNPSTPSSSTLSSIQHDNSTSLHLSPTNDTNISTLNEHLPPRDRDRNRNRIDLPTIASPTPLRPNAGASSGFAFPSANAFTTSAEPRDLFTPEGTPQETPVPTPQGSPSAGYRKLSLGVERFARAVEDHAPIGSFSGTVPLPSLSRNDQPASGRRPSHTLLDTISSGKPSADTTYTRSPWANASQAEPPNKNIGLNLNSIKRAISGKRRPQDLTMADLEYNKTHNDYNNSNDKGKPSDSTAANHLVNGIANDLRGPTNDGTPQAALSFAPKPVLSPAMDPVRSLAGINESQSSRGNEARRRFESNNSHSSAIASPVTEGRVRHRKIKGGVLSQLLKLQRNEAAAATASRSPSTASKSSGPLAQHPQIKKTKKGSFYRSSSKNNSLADLASSVTTTPKVSPRNSIIFEGDPSSTTRLPTQPSLTINNSGPLTKLGPHEHMEEMEALHTGAGIATLSTSLGIQRDIADILTRQSFLIMVAKALILYGAPTHRIEETCALMARKLDIDASFALLPGLMTISFSDPATYTSDTRHLRCTQGMDMNKLSKVYTIALDVLHGRSAEEANKALEKVTTEQGYYPVWVTVASWMVSAAFVAPLAFNGSWLDTALAGLCGLLVGLLGVVAAKYPVYGNVFEVTSSILVGFIAKAFGDRVCFSAVALAGIVVLLPGLLLTQAIMELASRNIVSGAVRMFYALMYAFFLGFGLTLGAEIWGAIGGDSSVSPSSSACEHAVNPWWLFLIFPVVSTSINIVFNAHPSQWLGMTLVTAVGFTISYFMPAKPHVTPAVAAFAVGITGQAYGRLTGQLSYVPLLSGVLLLVPGSVGVRGVLAIIGSNADQGFQFALHMVNISVSITLGVFCSSLVWYPFWRKSTFMNF